jgi:hypothetical protein
MPSVIKLSTTKRRRCQNQYGCRENEPTGGRGNREKMVRLLG